VGMLITDLRSPVNGYIVADACFVGSRILETCVGLKSTVEVGSCLRISRVDHSLRNACMGSMVAALRAGITDAHRDRLFSSHLFSSVETHTVRTLARFGIHNPTITAADIWIVQLVADAEPVERSKLLPTTYKLTFNLCMVQRERASRTFFRGLCPSSANKRPCGVGGQSATR